MSDTRKIKYDMWAMAAVPPTYSLKVPVEHYVELEPELPALPNDDFVHYVVQTMKESDGGKYIHMVKACRESFGLGLKEAKDYVEKIIDNYCPEYSRNNACCPECGSYNTQKGISPNAYICIVCAHYFKR